jgi:hypothetical protein
LEQSLIVPAAEGLETPLKIQTDRLLLEIQTRDQAPDGRSREGRLLSAFFQATQISFQLLLLDTEIIEISQVVLEFFQLADEAADLLFRKERCEKL